MRRTLVSHLAVTVLALGAWGSTAFAGAAPAAAGNPKVVLTTNRGEIVVELFADKAPKTVENILAYVDAGFYNGLVFHRVIPGFMIQGGGYDKDLKEKDVRAPVVNEATNGLVNERGTLAMARTSDPNSATSQFFINLVHNTSLDNRGKTADSIGYCVFGKVVSGMDVVDKIAATKTQCPSRGGGACDAKLPMGMRDVPADAVVITSAKRK